jgi:pyrroloquinoline quinone biosynthesis protein D
MTARRLIVDGDTVLRFPPHVKFRYDSARERWVVLAPERLLLPDEPSVEILRLLDGTRSVDRVVDALVEKFAAPRAEIATDVVSLLQDLADKGMVVA